MAHFSQHSRFSKVPVLAADIFVAAVLYPAVKMFSRIFSPSSIVLMHAKQRKERTRFPIAASCFFVGSNCDTFPTFFFLKPSAACVLAHISNHESSAQPFVFDEKISCGFPLTFVITSLWQQKISIIYLYRSVIGGARKSRIPKHH